MILKLKIKSLIKKVYKGLINNFFLSIYGKVFFSKNKLEKCSIQNVKINNFDYKIYKIKEARVFTNYVENLAVIVTIIKDFHFNKLKESYLNLKIRFLNWNAKILKFSGSTLILTQGASGHFNYAHWLFDIILKLKSFLLKTICQI